MKTDKYKTDIKSVLDIKDNPNYSITNKQWFQESELAEQIKQDTEWVDELNSNFTLNQRIILIRDNIVNFKECLICKSKIKFKQQLHKTSDYCSKSCVTKSTLNIRVLKRREKSKDKKCINYRLLKYKLECYDYKLKNNKPYNKRMYNRLLVNYIWSEYNNLDLVTKALIKYSKQRIFNIIKADLNFLIPEYEKEYQLDFNSSDKHRILKFEKEPRLCKYCSNKVITDSQFCSVKCSNTFKALDPSYIQTLSKAIIKAHINFTDEEKKSKNNKISTSLIQFNKNNIEEIISKNIMKWGYNYPQEHPDIIKKSKRTRLEKYGNENYTNREQTNITNTERYGGNGPYCSPDIIEKMQNNCILKYGVRNPAQTGLFTNEYKWKEYTTISGTILKYQGYENFLYDEIFKEYTEEEILTSRKDMPSIWYIGLDNKSHRYFPDLFIRKTNTIYEVKSEYTLNLGYETNMLKFQAVKDAGYNFILRVY
jgi:hypothetical protein